MLKYAKLLLLSAALLAPAHSARAQQPAAEENLIQFSGLLMTSDSLKGIPFAHVIILNRHKATITNHQGVFSFVAQPGDSVLFSAVGYKKEVYLIPADLKDNNYSIIQLMTKDTVYLPETLVYPWPTPERFKDAFLNLDIPDDDLERARKNLEREALKELGMAMKPDGNESSDYYLRQEAARFYYAGQKPPMNIFNPLAWAEFIQAWKNGAFKRQR